MDSTALVWLGKLLPLLFGLIGAILGVYNFRHARKKEAQERLEKDSAKQEAQAEWDLYTELLKASEEGLILQPPSEEVLKRAERLVEKGKLIRLPNGAGYAIPGQQYRIDIDQM